MELQGEHTISAGVETTWAALNDLGVLKSCLAGCESLERTGDDTLAAVIALKFGAVSARVNGTLAMTNIVVPSGCTIDFDGQGEAAGFGKGSADVSLSAWAMQGEPKTLLKYTARVTFGGKMAQIDLGLIDATATKITEDFFQAFEAHLRASAAPIGGPAAAAVAAPVIAPVTATAVKPSPEFDGSLVKLTWLIGAAIALAAVYFLIR